MITRKTLVTYAVAGAVAISPLAASGAVVCHAPNLAIPNNGDGLYINLITQATHPVAANVPGWDFNPYGSLAGELMFYLPRNGAVSGTGTVTAAIASGTLIGPAASFTTTSPTQGTILTPTAFWVGATQLLGIRFQNETTGATNFGWLELVTNAPSGFPMTVRGYCYENAGSSIVSGSVPVDLQAFDVE